MFPLKRRCQNCGGTRLEWRDASGTGTIYAHARLRRAYHPRHADRLPLILAWVDIPEGVRVMTNIVGADPATVRTGDAVRVVFENLPGGMAIPVFEPV